MVGEALEEEDRIGILGALSPANWSTIGWFWFALGLVGAILPRPFNILAGTLLFPPLIRYFQDSYFRTIDQWASCIMAIFLFTGAYLGFQQNIRSQLSDLSYPQTLTNQTSNSKKTINKTPTKPENLSLASRKRIYRKLVQAHQKASRKALKNYPIRVGDVREGFTFKTKKPLQFDGKCVSPNSKITISDRKKTNHSYRFLGKAYRDQCKPVEEWFGEKALINQDLSLFKNHFNQYNRLENKLTRKYESKILRNYDVSDRQLTLITLEGIRNNWSESS